MALGHGLQDAQKTMGVIFLALLTGGYVAAGDPLPLWVIFSAAAAISLGTWSGGWRIMRTLGRRIIHLDPARGFAAESVAASVLYTTAYVFEAPISTTHTITSAVMGVGATKRLSAVRWGVARSILTAWVLTFPAAGLAAAICYWVAALLHRGRLLSGRPGDSPRTFGSSRRPRSRPPRLGLPRASTHAVRWRRREQLARRWAAEGPALVDRAGRRHHGGGSSVQRDATRAASRHASCASQHRGRTVSASARSPLIIGEVLEPEPPEAASCPVVTHASAVEVQRTVVLARRPRHRGR